MTSDYAQILARMQERYRELAGGEADDASDIGIRLKVLAGEAARLAQRLENLEKQAFPQTAEGEALTLHAQQRGIERKEAVKASGSLRFGRDAPLWYDSPIPAGTVCAAPGGEIRFVTTEDAVLKAGSYEVDVPACAETGGRSGNASAESITVLVTPPEGILTVENPLPFTGGTDAENDEELRQRLLLSYRNIPNGTNAAFYREQALKVPEIRSVSVIPCENGLGTVGIYCAASGSAPPKEVLDALAATLDELREITVQVSVKPCETVEVDLFVTVTTGDGYTAQQVKESCEEALRSYFASLSIGQAVLLAAAGDALYHTDGVSNYAFQTSLCRDTAMTAKQLAVPGSLVVSIQTEGSDDGD